MFQRANRRFQKNWRSLVLIFVAMLLVESIAIRQNFDPNPMIINPDDSFSLKYLIIAIVVTILVTMLRVIIRAYEADIIRTDDVVPYSGVRYGSGRFNFVRIIYHSVVIGLIVGIISFIAMVGLLRLLNMATPNQETPGVIFLLIMLSVFVVVVFIELLREAIIFVLSQDNTMSLTEELSVAFQMVSQNFTQLFLAQIVRLLLHLIGVSLFFVGVLYLGPVGNLIATEAYLQAYDHSEIKK